MAKKRKRMTRKELKEPDKVLSTMEKGVEYVSSHRRPLAIGLVVVVVAVGLFIFYRVRTKNQAIEASKLYEKGLRTYTAIIDPSVKGASTKKGDEGQAFATREARAKAALAVFDKIVGRYEGYAVARAAHFYRGRCYFDLKKYGDAITAFKKVLSSKPGGGCGCGGGAGASDGSDALKALALENLGYAQAAKGRLDDARSTFAKLRSMDKGTRRDWAYYHDALIREQKGDLRGAIKSYEMVKTTGKGSKGQDPSMTFMLSPLAELSTKRARYLKMKLEGGTPAPRRLPRRRGASPRPEPPRTPAMTVDPMRPTPGAGGAMAPAPMPAMPAAMPAPRPAMPAAMPAPRPAMPAATPAPRPAMPAAMPAPRPAMPAPMTP